MNLKCMINGKISGVFLPNSYDNNRLLQGNTIAEDYSETLDSGSIILADVPKISNLDPYDDVYIWDCDFLPNFTGIEKTKVGDYYTADYSIFVDENNQKHFYKHFLLDRYKEERNLLNQNNYTYTIELFSETKGLENVILPNVKVTQPKKVSKRFTTLELMQHYLELYSPKIKIGTIEQSGKKFYEEPKYKLSVEMKEMFEEHYCQEFSLNSPTLRELFTKLMVTKDCIPIVKDNIIYPLCLAKTTGTFDITKDEKSFIQVQKTSDGYVTQLRTNYSNALSPNPTCHRVEQLGFRNSDEAIMTIENMRLETSFPIYKLNKVYMCYYKKCTAEISCSFDISTEGYKEVDFYFLCKQDISKLCVLNNERQALYKDTRVASKKTDLIDFMKDNYYFTVGYSIGSNLITGFGEKFSYVKSAGLSTWNETECIIRNILNNIDRLNPYGIDGETTIKNKIREYMNGANVLKISFKNDSKDNPKGIAIQDNNGTIPSIFLDKELTKILNGVHRVLDDVATASLSTFVEVPTKLTNAILIGGANAIVSSLQGDSLVIKGLTFEIDYEGFFNGAVMTNKEVLKNEITKPDNQSESMPYMDLDGISRERKIQKMGNKSYTISARYTNWQDVQDIGTTLTIKGSEENQDDDEEIIIYHRDISIYDNKIDVTYFGQESFVLKNFYTSVFAKQRLYNVLDYGSSITRAENVRDILYVSKDKLYNIRPNFNTDTYNSFFNANNKFFTLTDYLNFEQETDDDSNKKIDQSLLKFSNSSLPYGTDVNTFTYGNSICFNMKMIDNITMGTNIDPTHLSGKILGNITENGDDNYKGTSQKLCAVYEDNETGRTDTIDFWLCSSKKENETFASHDYSFNELKETLDYTDILYDILHPQNYDIAWLHGDDITPEVFLNTPYDIDTAKISIAEWQTKKLYYPLIVPNVPDNISLSNFLSLEYYPFDIKSMYTKKLYKDANEIIDMTFQTQLIVDKKNKNDIFISDLALKVSDLVGYTPKKYILSHPEGYITFVPFQLKNKANANFSYGRSSLQGIIVKVPNSQKDVIVSAKKELEVNYVLDIVTLKQDRLSSQKDNNIIKWKVDTKSIFFVNENTIRVNCNQIKVSYLDANNNEKTHTNTNSFFYLHIMDNQFITEKSSVNKNDFSYYSNISLTEDANDVNCIVPFLAKYYKDDISPWHPLGPVSEPYTTMVGVGQTKIVASPNDNNCLNTAFWGYKPDKTIIIDNSSVIIDKTNISPELTYQLGDYEITGQGYDSNNDLILDSLSIIGNMYNYYETSATSQDICSLDNVSNRNLLSYDYQAYSSTEQNYGLPNNISVFYDLDITSNMYKQWNIYNEYNNYQLKLENIIVCVVGKEKIETSIIDKKIASFDGNDYLILQENNIPIECNKIFVIQERLEKKNTGTLKIDLDYVPNHYDANKEKWVFDYNSIQEWIYNYEKESYEFICGFNINEEDVKKYNKYKNNESSDHYITIYLSIVGNLDLQVYDEKGMLKGKVKNRKNDANLNYGNDWE